MSEATDASMARWSAHKGISACRVARTAATIITPMPSVMNTRRWSRRVAAKDGGASGAAEGAAPPMRLPRSGMRAATAAAASSATTPTP